jgi:hypothetical protein
MSILSLIEPIIIAKHAFRSSVSRAFSWVRFRQPDRAEGLVSSPGSAAFIPVDSVQPEHRISVVLRF